MNKRYYVIFIFLLLASSLTLYGMTGTSYPKPPTPTGVTALEQEKLALGTLSASDKSTLEEPEQTNYDANSSSQSEDSVSSPKKDIYLNFENSTLANFVNYMCEIKKLNIIPDKGIEETKFSLTIRDPLSIEGAWSIFLTVLETAGFSMIQSGEVWKVLPKDKKLTEALPAYINVPPDSLPNSDIEIRYVMFLENVKVTDVRELLSSMLSNPNTLVDHQDANAFIITDKSFNIKAAAKLLLELDQVGLQETVTVIRLQKANAKDVADLLGTLIKKPDTNPLARLLGKAAEGATEYFSSTTRIIPEERTNSLILLGNNESINKLVNFVTKYIDTDLVAAASPLHIYECKHTDAEQIKNVLSEVTQAPESTVGQAAGKYGAIRGGVKYFKSMNFQVDKDGNRLIVSCTDKNDWRMLKKTLHDLDKPQPQVAIETLIVTVNSSDIKKLGGMVRNKKHGQIGHNIDFQSVPFNQSITPELSGGTTGDPISLLGNLLLQVATQQGSSVISFGKAATGNIWSVFQLLRSQTNATVLSQPFVTVANKTTASIKVGEERQVLSEQSNTGDSSFERVQVNTSIDVTPQINLEGLVRLDMQVSLQDFGDTQGRIRTDKTIKTSITVANGQVLVLGGFVKTNVSETKAKTPLLGDIPVLGWFFKNQNRTITKDYIFIFMVPTIIKPRQTPGTQLYTKMKMHSATSSIEEAIQTQPVNDPIHNWFFNPEKENYSHKVIDFANARYQPTTVDISNDPYYRSQTRRQELAEEKHEGEEKKLRRHVLQLDATPSAQKHQTSEEPSQSVSPNNSVPSSGNMKHVPITQSNASHESEMQKLPLIKSKPPQIIQEISDKSEQQLLNSTQPVLTTEPAQATVNYDRTSEQVPAYYVSDEELEVKRQKLKALLTNRSTEETVYSPNKDVSELEQKRIQLKTLIADDNQDDAPNQENKRIQFKELLASPQEPSHTDETLLHKRQQLKELFADTTSSSGTKDNQQEFFVDPSKRNKLKDFLAQQELQEKNISFADRSSRKALA